jgi:hypothetical protein
MSETGRFEIEHAIFSATRRYLARDWALISVHRVQQAGTGVYVCSCPRGVECTSKGKHPVPQRWQQPEQWITPTTAGLRHAVAVWNDSRPLNIGLVTGRPSGVWCLDFDPAHVGNTPGAIATTDLIAQLLAEGYEPAQRTGGGGDHWLFTLPEDFEITNSRGRLPRGLDVRGDGGMIVLAPSVSSKGPYVDTGMSVHVPPDWLLDYLKPIERERPTDLVTAPEARPQGAALDADRGHRYAAGAVRDILTQLAAAQEGERDAKAFEAACQLHELINAPWSGLHELTALHQYLAACEVISAAGLTPFTHAEAEKCWLNGQQRVAGKARELPAHLPPEMSPEIWSGLPPEATDPFPPAPQGGAYGSGSPGYSLLQFIDPTALGTPAAVAAPYGSPASDPFEQAVAQEAYRLRVREEARRRLDAARLGDRDAAKAALRAELLDTPALKARPRLVPIVPGLLYRNSLARLIGSSGHGKSFVALDLAARVGAGLAWAGRPVTRGRVTWLVAEGDEGVGKRLDAWETLNGRAVENVRYLPRPVNALGPEWELFCEVLAESPDDLIILDTQARITPGADEIDRAEASQLVEACDQLRRMTGACVLLIHHRGQKGTHARGHTEVYGALQTQLYCEKKGPIITVGARAENGGKTKDDAEPADVTFRLKSVPLPAVADPSTGFVDPVEPGAAIEWVDGDTYTPSGEEYAGEPVGMTRARALWTVIHDYFNPGDGGTRAEIRAMWMDTPLIAPLNSATKRQAWRSAWNLLIERGLIAKRFRGDRFKLVVVSDQSSDGVLTVNPDIATGGVGDLDSSWGLWTNEKESRDNAK